MLKYIIIMLKVTMTIQFFNSLSQKVEEFSIHKNINIYSCGPTVYDYAHIGNLRTFLFEDLLIRTLKSFDYKITHIRNLTDIDDKIIQRSQSSQIPLEEFTEKYINEFLLDLSQLNFDQDNTSYLKATDYISEMIILIQKLIDSNHAYESKHGIYFKISSFKKYGGFAGLDLENLQANTLNNPLIIDKEEFGDFVLWKKYKSMDGNIFWNSPWGKGRPGWHTECAAIVHSNFNDQLDIHTGGIDLLFPHHTNEKAHCECLNNKSMAKFWLHATHLLVDNKKMSKSLGNFYTLRDLQDKGFSNQIIRFYLLTGAHYRSPLNFTLEGLKGSETALKRLNNFIAQLIKSPTNGDSYNLKNKFIYEISNDLNISSAMGIIFTLVNQYYLNPNYNSSEIIQDLKFINNILGFLIFPKNEDEIPHKVLDLFNQRNHARQNQNWQKSDHLREELLKYNYEIVDSKEKSILKKKYE